MATTKKHSILILHVFHVCVCACARLRVCVCMYIYIPGIEEITKGTGTHTNTRYFGTFLSTWSIYIYTNIHTHALYIHSNNKNVPGAEFKKEFVN